ncbi:MAG: 2-C-methyl-D-erythritol 2,4-cyclodiphosphate synthase [Gammaproteobacteria bacterium]
MPYRVGQGVDVHAFGEPQAASQITLGGVAIPCDRPLLAHSDGDVLLHALCDALLGAVGQGDIGQHFPDEAAEYADADSRSFVLQVYEAVRQAGYELGNADLTIVAQRPKMAPYRADMQTEIAKLLACDPTRINVKATTTEHLGFTGRAEGIACFALVLLVLRAG